jgi:SAM-dependent methyltransferase
MNRKGYVKKYYDWYAEGTVEKEVTTVALFLAKKTYGRVLDCGCGPVPQIWAICMPCATEIRAIDLPKESISFVKSQLRQKEKWYKKFYAYQKVVEKEKGKLPSDYILSQIAKLKSVQQADMTKPLPFPSNYFDTAISLYSLGVLKSEKELDHAVKNISRVLKPGGILLHINTDGQNSNLIVPEYSWNGLPQVSGILLPSLEKYGFTKIKVRKITLSNKRDNMYKYGAISLLSAVKKPPFKSRLAYTKSFTASYAK